MSDKEKFGIKVSYCGGINPALDTQIKDVAIPGIWWAQGYDLVINERDIVFDYKSEKRT